MHNPSFRQYSGSLGDKSRLHSAGRGGPYSPIIEIDDDSHSRYVGPGGVAGVGGADSDGRNAGRAGGRHGGAGGGDDLDDAEYKSEMYCQPRNSLLSIVAEFVAKVIHSNKKHDRIHFNYQIVSAVFD